MYTVPGHLSSVLIGLCCPQQKADCPHHVFIGLESRNPTGMKALSHKEVRFFYGQKRFDVFLFSLYYASALKCSVYFD